MELHATPGDPVIGNILASPGEFRKNASTEIEARSGTK